MRRQGRVLRCGGGLSRREGGGSSGPGSCTTPMAPVTIAWIAKVAVATLFLTSAGLLAVWLAARVLDSKSQQSTRPPDPIELSTSPLPTKPKPLEVPESTSPVGASLIAEPDQEPTSEDRPKSAPVPRRRQASAVSHASRDTFAEEIILIDAARNASTPEVALASPELGCALVMPSVSVPALESPHARRGRSRSAQPRSRPRSVVMGCLTGNEPSRLLARSGSVSPAPQG